MATRNARKAARAARRTHTHNQLQELIVEAMSPNKLPESGFDEVESRNVITLTAGDLQAAQDRADMPVLATHTWVDTFGDQQTFRARFGSPDGKFQFKVEHYGLTALDPAQPKNVA